MIAVYEITMYNRNNRKVGTLIDSTEEGARNKMTINRKMGFKVEGYLKTWNTTTKQFDFSPIN